jgi:hypothetical protein
MAEEVDSAQIGNLGGDPDYGPFRPLGYTGE